MPVGYKLAQRKGRRKWSDPDTIAVFMQSEFGNLPVMAPVSPPQLEKIAGKDAAADFIQTHAEQPLSAPYLTKDKDGTPGGCDGCR